MDKVGYIHVTADEDEELYNIQVLLQTRPTNKILGDITSEVITNGLVDIFKGMFNLVE